VNNNNNNTAAAATTTSAAAATITMVGFKSFVISCPIIFPWYTRYLNPTI
jgi:hypothetical protein